MWFHSAFDFLRVNALSRGRRTRHRQAASRLLLELLEDRTVPSLLPPVDYAVGQLPETVVSAGLRNDGIQDLVVANRDSNTVTVLLGSGTGTFQQGGTFPAGGTAPGVLVVGDLTGNGNLDVVVADEGNSSTPSSLSVLLGNGDGSFQAPINFTLPGEFPPGYTGSVPLPQDSASVALGDMNHDGRLDLVVAAQTTFSAPSPSGGTSTVSNGYVNVLLGNGDGTFTVGSTTLLDVQQPGLVTLADFNGDGNLDVAMASSPDNGVCVLLGNGNGTLRAPSFFATDDSPDALVVGDVNGDGTIDLVTTNVGQDYIMNQNKYWAGSVSVLLGNGDGTFQPASTTQLPTVYVPGWTGWSNSPPPFVPQVPESAVMGDLNKDGTMDLMVTATYEYSGYVITPSSAPYAYWRSQAGTNVNVLLGNGDGTFTDDETFPLGNGTNFYPAMTTGDFNGDTFPDLAVVDSTNTLSVLLNGDGLPSAPSSFAVSGFPSPTQAGASGSFTVTARNADGTIDTGFTGTVHFTSSDGQAALAGDYTFTASDAGVHTFSAVLKTTGTQSLSAADGSISGSESGITVTAAAASKMIVAGFPSPTTAGVAGSVTVTLEDPYGNVASGYRGTVHFTSSDAKAVLPANYTFTASDGGVHTFSATLKTAGTQSITATDTVTAGLTGTDGNITVNPAAASKFILTAPASVNAGASFSLTLKVEDAYGNVVTNYPGTVHFSSTDRKATLPANYTFTTADKGVHTFSGLVLRTKGNQKITIMNTHNSSLTVSVIVDVL